MRPGSEVVFAACLFGAALIPGKDVAPLRAPFRLDLPFTLGVVRRDGIVIPFATYDGKRWRTDWPPPRGRVEIPISLKNVPSRWWGPLTPVDTWQVSVGNEPLRTVHVRQPDWFEAQCLKQIGLRTDYQPGEPPPGPDAQPYPKDGLAVSPPRQILPIDLVPAGAAPPEVVNMFNAEEPVAIAQEQRWDQWSHPLTRKQRELVPLKTEAIYAAGDTRARVYYFEVSKEYVNPKELGPNRSTCVSVSYGEGWFVKEGDTLRPLGFRVAIAPCNRYGLLYMLPLGATRISNQLFWIAQFSGWDYEEYDIMEIKAKEVDIVLKVSGGRC